MAEFTERVQVLVSPAQLAELRRIARRERRSVGSLVRDAVEATYFRADHGDVERRLEAVERLVAMSLPVADWEQMERDATASGPS